MSQYAVGDRIVFDDPDFGPQRLTVDYVREGELDASRIVPGDSRSICYTIKLDHERLRAER